MELTFPEHTVLKQACLPGIGLFSILHTMKNLFLAVYSITALVFSASVFSQELTPRAYWPAPKGTQVATIGLSHYSGDIVPDPSLPITGVDSSISSLSFGYLQTISLFGRTANAIIQVPFSDGDTKGDGGIGENLRREYQGIGDISASISVNLFGAPTMTKSEFAELRSNPGPIIGASLKIVAPTGKYDSQRLINVGANRWAAKAELGGVIPITRKWLLEADLGGWFFGDNDDFVGFNKEQKPIIALQTHIIHRFSPGVWASLDASVYKGGRNSLDGRKLDDLQRDSKFGFTVVFPIARTHVFKLGYSKGSTIDSDEDFDVYQLVYSRIF